MLTHEDFQWRDADARRPQVWLYLGQLYVARIKALRPGQWWYALASPDIAELNHGAFDSPYAARAAAETAVLKAIK